MNKKLCRYIATSLVFALLLAVPSFAAHHYTGNQYAVYGSGKIGVEAYIYYNSNTSSSINVTSSVMFIRNYTANVLDHLLFRAIEMPSNDTYNYSVWEENIGNGDLKRVELPVNETFSKTTGSNGYVFFQSKVAIGEVSVTSDWYYGDVSVTVPGVYIGWDTFCYPNSFSSSFHS